MFNFISLGGGVQSSAMALMASRGEIEPMPTAAIFADTHAEPAAVYAWLARIERDLAFPLYRVSAGNLAAIVGTKPTTWKHRRVDIPAFIRNADGGRGGMANRSCTRDYKVRPIIRKVRELVGLTRKRAPAHVIVRQWIGISIDEWQRIKPSGQRWIENVHPLVDRRISRQDCIAWLERNGYHNPPKSSCVFCPYHSKHQWSLLQGEDLELAYRVDDALREAPPSEYRLKGTMYIHPSLRPLREVVPGPKPEFEQLDMFANECFGVCGV